MYILQLKAALLACRCGCLCVSFFLHRRMNNAVTTPLCHLLHLLHHFHHFHLLPTPCFSSAHQIVARNALCAFTRPQRQVLLMFAPCALKTRSRLIFRQIRESRTNARYRFRRLCLRSRWLSGERSPRASSQRGCQTAALAPQRFARWMRHFQRVFAACK